MNYRFRFNIQKKLRGKLKKAERESAVHNKLTGFYLLRKDIPSIIFACESRLTSFDCLSQCERREHTRAGGIAQMHARSHPFGRAFLPAVC